MCSFEDSPSPPADAVEPQPSPQMPKIAASADLDRPEDAKQSRQVEQAGRSGGRVAAAPPQQSRRIWQRKPSTQVAIALTCCVPNLLHSQAWTLWS